MVAVDDRRNPVAVAPLQPATPDELRRHAAAIARKQLRQEFAQRAPRPLQAPAGV
jgi:acyl-CoA hydrolase